jgi:HEAT repeat protein
MALTPIRAALAGIRSARSIDAGDEYSDQLAKAALRNPQEVIDLYHAGEEDPFTLVWCLQGQTSERVLKLLREAIHHRSSHVRWAAIAGLKHFRRPGLMSVFTAGLRDRSHFVKLGAVEWLANNGDETAIPGLRRLLTLPNLARYAPGIVTAAANAVERIEKRSGRSS